jgi:hypothetical protein
LIEILRKSAKFLSFSEFFLHKPIISLTYFGNRLSFTRRWKVLCASPVEHHRFRAAQTSKKSFDYFQERNMKRILLLTACVVLCFGSLAAAKTTEYNFTFQNSAGDYFCDGMVLYVYGTPKTLVDGYQDGCYDGYNTNGFKSALSADWQFDATGATLILGTSTNEPSSLIYLLNPVYRTWVNWESGGGSGEFVLNYGYWDTTPGAKPHAGGTKASGAR